MTCRHREINLDFDGGKQGQLVPNQYTRLKFSHNGKRLIAGVAPIIAPDDTTIVDFEQGKLDIWVWDKPMNPPMEQHELDEIKKHNYPVAVNLSDFHPTLITDLPLAEVKAPDRWDGDWALVQDPTVNIVSHQWDYFAPIDMYVVNVNTGEKREAGEFLRSHGSELSPSDRFVIWYRDRNYYTYEIATGKTVCISDKVDVPLWDIDDRHPSPADNYGVAAWSENDDAVLVYDKYDIWSLDPAASASRYVSPTGMAARMTSGSVTATLTPRIYVS